MNLNFTSFPFIEKVLIYGGVFISSVFIIILSSLLHRERSGKKIGIMFYYISLVFIFFSDIFLFFYVKHPLENVCGIEINRIYLFLLILLISCYLLMFNEFEKTEDYIMGLISIIVLQLIFLSPSFVIVFTAFIIFDMALSYLSNRIKPQKFFYVLISFIFTGFFLLSDKTRLQVIGINGGLVFLLLSTYAAGTINSVYVSEKENNKYKNTVFFPMVISMAVFFKMIEFFNTWTPVIYPLFIASFILLILSVYNLLTEEDIKNFFISDFANIFFLSLLSFSAANINNIDILIIVVFMLMAGVLLNSFFSYSTGLYSVSYVRYNFNKIKSAGNLFLGIILTFFIEIYLIYRIINSFVCFNPYVQTMFLFTGFVYAINLLNKLFIIFSMVVRIKIDNLKNILFNKIIIRPVLFTGLIISLIYWWIKNG